MSVQTGSSQTAAAEARRRVHTAVRLGEYRSPRLEFTLDVAEHERRRAAGFTALERFDQLDLMLELPAGHPVRLRDLSARDRRALRSMPAGTLALDPDAGTVTRLVTPVASLEVAWVHARGALSFGDLERASVFAPFCRRAVALPRRAEHPDTWLLSQADFYGIGVGVRFREQRVRWLLRPEVYRPARFTPAAWRFAERVYLAWLKRQPAASTAAFGPSPAAAQDGGPR